MMDPKEQRIAIAEACGWTPFSPHRDPEFWYRPEEKYKELCRTCTLPDFLNDLNAMHEAEKILSKNTIDIRSLYYDYLALTVPQWPKKRDETFEHEYSMVVATAQERAEAFLRTMGTWKDDE